MRNQNLKWKQAKHYGSRFAVIPNLENFYVLDYICSIYMKFLVRMRAFFKSYQNHREYSNIEALP